MFGRTKTSPAPAPSVPAPQSPSPSEQGDGGDGGLAGTGGVGTGKGRPTPRRREAEQRNRRPLVAPPAPPKSALTKQERKELRAERRKAAAQERLLTRQALLSGDERHLPARDQGPARRWVRDHVDARRSPGEYTIPVVLLMTVLMFGVPQLGLIWLIAVYALMITVAVDAFLLRRRVNRLTTARFGADRARGAGTYAMMRSLQLRRTRMPRPVVRRGEYPA